MKFLIAASLVCLALIGQAQGGSLRGYTYKVPVPHQIYGAPLGDNEILIEEPKPNFNDIDTITVEQPAVPEIQNIPLVDSLPFVDSAVNFGISSGTQSSLVVPTVPQPELPYLQPGLPGLPERPVVPVVTEVYNSYLPPVRENSHPSEVYGPPAVPQAEVFSTVTAPPLPSQEYGLPPVVSKVSEILPVPKIEEIPALPAAPVTPSAPITAAPKLSETYGPPAVPSQVYGVPEVYDVPAPVTPSVPVPVAPAPSSVYGPPIVVTEGPSVPKISEIPALPAAPVIPSVPAQVYDVPAAPVTAEPTPSVVYGPPTVASVPQVVIPSVPLPSPIEKKVETVQVTIPSPVPIVSAHTFSIRPIVSQIVGFAGQLIPIGSGIDSASAPVKVPEELVAPAAVPSKTGYNYDKPAKEFRTPVTIGLASHVENSASSSSSSFQINHVIIPSVAQPSGSDDSVTVDGVKPPGPGFTIQSASGNTASNSTGTFNQISFINHARPQLSPIPGFVGVGIPHSVYAVPSF